MAVENALVPQLDLSRLKEGDVYYNFNDLRRALGLNTDRRMRKDTVLNELYRFVDFSTPEKGYVINRIRKVPFHKKAPKQYQELIQVMLHAHLASTPSLVVETTYKQLYYDLAMTGAKYPLIYNEDAYEIMSKDLTDINITEPVFNEFRRVSGWGMKDKIRSALDYMKKQQLVLWQENLWICHDLKLEGGWEFGDKRFIHKEASDYERSCYLNIRRGVLNDYGYDNIKTIYKKNLAKEYKEEVDKRLVYDYGWCYAYNKLKIWYNYQDMKVSLEEAKKSLLEESTVNDVEVKKDILNNKIMEMIEKRGESFYNNNNKKLQRLNEEWGNSLEGIKRYSMIADENAALAWKILTGYFISRDEDVDISAFSAFTPQNNYDDLDDIII